MKGIPVTEYVIHLQRVFYCCECALGCKKRLYHCSSKRLYQLENLKRLPLSGCGWPGSNSGRDLILPDDFKTFCVRKLWFIPSFKVRAQANFHNLHRSDCGS